MENEVIHEINATIQIFRQIRTAAFQYSDMEYRKTHLLNTIIIKDMYRDFITDFLTNNDYMLARNFYRETLTSMQGYTQYTPSGRWLCESLEIAQDIAQHLCDVRQTPKNDIRFTRAQYGRNPFNVIKSRPKTTVYAPLSSDLTNAATAEAISKAFYNTTFTLLPIIINKDLDDAFSIRTSNKHIITYVDYVNSIYFYTKRACLDFVQGKFGTMLEIE